jgi:hypothetical protein
VGGPSGLSRTRLAALLGRPGQPQPGQQVERLTHDLGGPVAQVPGSSLVAALRGAPRRPAQRRRQPEQMAYDAPVDVVGRLGHVTASPEDGGHRRSGGRMTPLTGRAGAR